MNLDLTIERISNGFIATTENKQKTYYPTLKAIVECLIVEPIMEADRKHQEHDTEGYSGAMIFKLTDI